MTEIVWQAFTGAEAFREGEFGFASGTQSTLKVDASYLYRHPKHLNAMLNLFKAHPVIARADVLMYVPDGMKTFTKILAQDLGKKIAHTRKIPDATERYQFEFCDSKDQALARRAEHLTICEDVVSTLGSVAAVRALLPEDQQVSSLAMLLRGEVNPDYQKGLDDHYLLEREVSTDKAAFREMYGDIAVNDAQ